MYETRWSISGDQWVGQRAQHDAWGGIHAAIQKLSVQPIGRFIRNACSGWILLRTQRNWQRYKQCTMPHSALGRNASIDIYRRILCFSSCCLLADCWASVLATRIVRVCACWLLVSFSFLRSTACNGQNAFRNLRFLRIWKRRYPRGNARDFWCLQRTCKISHHHTNGFLGCAFAREPMQNDYISFSFRRRNMKSVNRVDRNRRPLPHNKTNEYFNRERPLHTFAEKF